MFKKARFHALAKNRSRLDFYHIIKMRTVDPELWSRKVKRYEVQVTRRTRFGQQQTSCGLESRLRQSLWDAADEFWQNCSMACVKWFRIDGMIKRERWRHVLVLVVSLVAGGVLLLHGTTALLARPPLVVSLQSDDTSITHYKFPAVALCSNKIISKAALLNFTTYLYHHHVNKEYRFTKSEIEYNLLNMGALLTLALPNIKMEFQQFFRAVEPNYNITDIMFRLAADCSSILERCSWRGQLVPCEQLFGTRLTPLGFCCVFNSRYQPTDVHRDPAVLDLIGKDYGLGVVAREIRDDFAYVRRPAYGMELMLFEGDEYPLIESGEVRLYPLPRNSSIYFNIRVFKQIPSDNLKHYTEERRGCRLQGSGMAHCLTECRRDTVEALCGCVPYALQPQFVPLQVPTCTLNEIGCLNKHREKFMYVYPGAEAHPTLSQELQDSLDCPDCLVKCRRQLFSARASYSFYRNKTRVFRSFLSANMSLVNSTTIRLFYSIEHQEWYKIEALARGHELIVALSTQWIVVTGVSILNFSELLYHATFRWMHHFIRRTRIAKMQPVVTSM